MPQVSQVYVDLPMTNVSLAYKNIAYVSEELFPVIPVPHDTGIYYEYLKSRFTADNTDVRAPGTRAQRIEYKLQKNTYGPLDDHSLEIQIPDEERKNSIQPLDPDTDATIELTEKAKLYKEVNAASKFTDTSVITQYSTPAALWNDYANSNPITDVQTAKNTVSKAVQVVPEMLDLYLSYPVYAQLINHPDIIERVKYSQLGIVNADTLRQVFQVRSVRVMFAVKNTAKEGQTTSLDYVWGKHAWLVYRTATPGLRQVNTGYTLNMPEIAGPWVIEAWREQAEKSDYKRISYYYQQFIMAAPAIYFFNGAVA